MHIYETIEISDLHDRNEDDLDEPLNRSKSSMRLEIGKRITIAIIVYIATFLDNVLLTVIVPILPDYLATLKKRDSTIEAFNLAGSLNSGSTADIQNLAYHSSYRLPNLHRASTKHPIPGSMSNFTLSHLNHEEGHLLADENGQIGLLLAMKALVQLIMNPIVGNLSAKYGYCYPIVVGSVCLLLSSLVFAVCESYGALIIARAIHGIGSACIGVCGMSLVAQHYPEKEYRSKIMGVILGSIALGVLIGYPFGSILYDAFGKSSPFIILTTIISLNLENGTNRSPEWKKLLKNIMVLAIVVAIWFSTSTMAILEPCLPIWLIENLQPTKWQLGTVFIPDSIGYFIGTNFFGRIAYKYGQIKISFISLLLVGTASILIPNSTSMGQLLLPHFFLGLGIGIIDASLVPLLATIVDGSSNHEQEIENQMTSYGSVYAIQQTSVSLAYCFAPLLGGELAEAIGFTWLMRIAGIFNIIYAPILVYIFHKHDPSIIDQTQNDIPLTSTSQLSRYRQIYNSIDMN